MTTKLPEEGFIELATVLKVIKIGRSTWYEGVKAGRYPPGVQITQRKKVWRVEDIRDLMANPPPFDAYVPGRWRKDKVDSSCCKAKEGGEKCSSEGEPVRMGSSLLSDDMRNAIGDNMWLPQSFESQRRVCNQHRQCDAIRSKCPKE